ncbi:MAG: hypothetical protein ACRCVT_01080 [Leadbetterella sp.]
MVRIAIFLVFSFFSRFVFSQVAPSSIYSFTIQKGKFQKQGKITYLLVSATLTNHSKDTLNYTSMSCSWEDFYIVDNKNMGLEHLGCDKNAPIVLTLPPSQNRKTELPIIINPKIDFSDRKCRIGFYLIKKLPNQNIYKFNFQEEKEKENIIWSNWIDI